MAESHATASGSQATPDAPSLPHDSREYAEYLTSQDPLKHLREEFFIPSKADLASETLPKDGEWEFLLCHAVPFYNSPDSQALH